MAIYVVAMLVVTIVAVLVARETAAVGLGAESPKEEEAAAARGSAGRLRPLFH